MNQLATDMKISSALPSLFPPPLEVLARVSQGWVLGYRQLSRHLITVMLSDVTPADSLQTTPNDLALMFTLSPDHQIHRVSAIERGSSVQRRCSPCGVLRAVALRARNEACGALQRLHFAQTDHAVR